MCRCFTRVSAGHGFEAECKVIPACASSRLSKIVAEDRRNGRAIDVMLSAQEGTTEHKPRSSRTIVRLPDMTRRGALPWRGVAGSVLVASSAILYGFGMASSEGVEPTTFGVEIRRSILLSYEDLGHSTDVVRIV